MWGRLQTERDRGRCKYLLVRAGRCVEDARPGVTADSIKLGVSLIDFKCIQQFIDFTRPNQQAIYQAFIDDVNANDGINGRKIVADFNTECPLSATSDLLVQVCTGFTDDDKVFAVIGNIGDAAQDAAIHTCIAKQHKTPVVTFQVTEDMFKQIPPGMIVFPGTTPERSSAVLFELLQKAGTLDGKKLAVFAQQTSQASVKAYVLPAIKKTGVETGTTAYVTINGSDTTAAQSQLDSFIERWKSEGVNALFITGQNAVTKQFVEKIVKQIPGVMLLTDTSDAVTQGQDETKAGVNPNPYEGLYLAGGYRAADYAKSDNWKYCASIYKAATGKEAPGPEAVRKVTVDGKELTDQTYNTINDACQMVSTFQQIVAKIGPVRERAELGRGGRFVRQDRQPRRRTVRLARTGQVRHRRHLPAPTVRLDAAAERQLEGARRLPEHPGVAPLVRRVRALDGAVVGAQIRRDDERVVAHRFGIAVRDHRARLHAVDAIADRHDQR